MSTIWMQFLGHPVKQSFYDAGGVRTRAIEAGSGDPLILLHGTGGHAEAYARNIVSHSRHFHVYAIDMIGHGYTDAPDVDYDMADFVEHLESFVEAIGADRVFVSGESLGAMVATWFAIRNPEKIRRLVLNTGILTKRDDEAMAQLRELLDRSRKASDDLTRDSVRHRLAWLMHEPDKSVTDELVDVRYTIYSQPGRAAMIRKMSEAVISGALEESDWHDPVNHPKIQCETLVLWTRHNPGVSAELAQQAMANIPTARFEMLENSAHWPQWEEPEEFDRIHMGFLLDG